MHAVTNTVPRANIAVYAVQYHVIPGTAAVYAIHGNDTRDTAAVSTVNYSFLHTRRPCPVPSVTCCIHGGRVPCVITVYCIHGCRAWNDVIL